MIENLIFGAVTLLLGVIAGSWLKGKFSPVAKKVGTYADSAEKGLDAIGDIAIKFGYVSAGSLVHKAADVVDEAGKLADFLAISTEDGKFDTSEAKKALEMGKNVYTISKDFVVSVKPIIKK
jgi:hypothetical protein